MPIESTRVHDGLELAGVDHQVDLASICQWCSQPLPVNNGNKVKTVREMALTGLGIALSPLWLFADDLNAGRVVALLQDYTPLSLPIHAVCAPNRRQSARVKAFVDYMADALALAPELQSVKSRLYVPATTPTLHR